MISTLGDLHRWARDVAIGKLLTPAAQKQRARFIPEPGLKNVGDASRSRASMAGSVTKDLSPATKV